VSGHPLPSVHGPTTLFPLTSRIKADFSIAIISSTNVGGQLQWDSSTWSKFAADPDSKLWMPWVASRRDIEDFPVDGPGNCRVIVFDCISYSVPYMRILTIDEDRCTALTQESESHYSLEMINVT